MNFNMHQSVDEREYFLDSLITRKLLKLVDNISNQSNRRYDLYFFLKKKLIFSILGYLNLIINLYLYE